MPILLIPYSSGGGVVIVPPSVTTSPATLVSPTTAQANGNVTSAGNGTITERGFVWGINANPTVLDNGGGKLIVAGTTGVYSGSMTGLVPNTTYHVRAYAINSAGTSYGVDTTFLTVSASITPKKSFYYKIFDSTGAFNKIWSKEVINLPTFKNVLNQGHSDMTIQLSRKFDDFGEGVDVNLNNRVELWVCDRESPNGVLMYVGYISGYDPIFDSDKEYLEVHVFPYEADFSRIILRDSSGNTTLTYTAKDPGVILKDVIDKYRALGGKINYALNSVQMANQVVTYTFRTNTIQECLDQIIAMYPSQFYWRVDTDLNIYVSPPNTLADLTFTLGKEMNKLQTFRRIEDLINRVVLVGSGNPALYAYTQNTGSQATYGLYEKKIIDQRVSDLVTGAYVANHYINNQSAPEIRSVTTIVDSNGPKANRGYDIESVKIGQTFSVQNLKVGSKTDTLWDVGVWDTDVWDQTLQSSAASVIQILSTTWNLDSMVIEASSRLPLIARRVEELLRRLEVTQSVNNPAAPTAN